MTDGRHKMKFVGPGAISWEALEKIKVDFEETVAIGYEDEFGLEINLEWAIDEEALYVSHEVFSMWEEEPEELLEWIKGFFLSSVETIASNLDDDGEGNESAKLRRTYLTIDEEDNYYGREEDDYDDEESFLAKYPQPWRDEDYE